MRNHRSNLLPFKLPAVAHGPCYLGQELSFLESPPIIHYDATNHAQTPSAKCHGLESLELLELLDLVILATLDCVLVYSRHLVIKVPGKPSMAPKRKEPKRAC